MKIHDKSSLFLGVTGATLGIAYILRGRTFDWFFGIAWLAIGIAHLRRAFDEKWAEKNRATNENMKAAARKRFGAWTAPVRYFGLALVILALVLGWCVPGRTTVWLLPLLAGVLYTIIMETWLKSEAEAN